MARVDRFYVGTELDLKHDFWIHDDRLLHQWRKVLRLQAGNQVVLFDGVRADRLYSIAALTEREAHVQLVTDFVRQVPEHDVYLIWSLLKKDKNDWVLQKATELGVRHFVPLLAERSEKTGFDVDRAHKIVVEAAEQCGRSDIPSIREPMLVRTVLEHLGPDVRLHICEQGHTRVAGAPDEPVGVLVGPEGGWSDREKSLFESAALPHIGLGAFTLRAETAAVTAAGLLAVS